MKDKFKKFLNYLDKHRLPVWCILLLALVLNATLSLTIMSYGNKNLDKYVVGIETKLDKNMFKVMLEDSTGGYTESIDNTFPSYDYFFNPSKSGCIDSEGNKLDNSLIFDINTRKVSINVSKTSYCYLYFDKLKEVPSNLNLAQKLITNGNMWQSGLEGDGYRFVGSGNATAETTPDNFICFGTSDAATCKANEEKYLYRIIGVFDDANGNKHVKLIKYYSLPSTQYWHTSNSDTNWGDSSLKTGLNGSFFATNTTFDYMQSTEWTNKITNWSWSAVNTKTYESSGPNYYNGLNTGQIYLHEMNRTSKTSTIGVWTQPQAKIGLMYGSDYQMSLGNSALTYKGSSNAATLKTGWMHISNNAYGVTTSPSDSSHYQYEWTISRYGNCRSNYRAGGVDLPGYLNDGYVSSYSFSVRPVFYLESNTEYISGTGDYLDPIIIGEENRISATNDGTNVTATITPGEYELHKYCINTSQTNLSSCEWKDASTNITDTLSESGDYYLHVVDKGGYVMHSDKMTYIAYEQLENYMMIYDNGNELNQITGGWRYSYVNSASANIIVKNESYIKMDAPNNRCDILCDNKIDLTNYSKGFAVVKSSLYSSGDISYDIYCDNNTEYLGGRKLLHSSGLKALINTDAFGTNVRSSCSVGVVVYRANAELYNIGFVKPDNWQSICTKAVLIPPSDIATLLADTTSLRTIFNKGDAVEYMAKQCTGDFMAEAVSSTTFKTALEASPYKNTIKNNVHWAKFLSMANNS